MPNIVISETIKASFYICREDTMDGGGVGTEPFVNGSSLGGLKTNTFAHTVMEPGEISVFLRRKGLNFNSGNSAILKITGKPREVVDTFPSETQARSCIQKAA
jgi:hypothetical protein